MRGVGVGIHVGGGHTIGSAVTANSRVKLLSTRPTPSALHKPVTPTLISCHAWYDRVVVCGCGNIAINPAFIIAAGAVVFRTNTVPMSGAEFSGYLIESEGGLDLRDAELKFFLVGGR